MVTDLFGGDLSDDTESDSDFEYDSPPGSPVLSSGYESIISEDLDLYEDRCVC
jgi:hypothetical protein